MKWILKLFISLAAVACTQSESQAVEYKMVELQTNKGNIKIELMPEEAPVTVKNFLSYVEDGHFDGTIFHRVIDGFMIQGGGFDKEMNQKPVKDPIKNESANGLQNQAMTLAMARTQDPDSATAQFFINLADNDFLNGSDSKPGYAVFGKVVEGEEVVREIAKVETTTKGFHENVPVESIVINKAVPQKEG